MLFSIGYILKFYVFKLLYVKLKQMSFSQKFADFVSELDFPA
jgi:hypothetical protein